MRHAFFDGFACKYQREFLSTVAISPTATADFRQFAGDQPQYLVTHVMAVGVVEFLEMVHVAHRHYIIATQALHAFIQRPTSRQADRKSTRLNSSHSCAPRMPSSA